MKAVQVIVMSLAALILIVFFSVVPGFIVYAILSNNGVDGGTSAMWAVGSTLAIWFIGTLRNVKASK